MNAKDVQIVRVVTPALTAQVMKSGSLPVLATPAMIAWMEEAACLALELEAGQTSVGTSIAVSHDAPSPIGAEILVEAKVDQVDGRRIDFLVSASMDEVQIGHGRHSRVIVNEEKFLNRIDKRSHK